MTRSPITSAWTTAPRKGRCEWCVIETKRVPHGLATRLPETGRLIGSNLPERRLETVCGASAANNVACGRPAERVTRDGREHRNDLPAHVYLGAHDAFVVVFNILRIEIVGLWFEFVRSGLGFGAVCLPESPTPYD